MKFSSIHSLLNAGQGVLDALLAFKQANQLSELSLEEFLSIMSNRARNSPNEPVPGYVDVQAITTDYSGDWNAPVTPTPDPGPDVNGFYGETLAVPDEANHEPIHPVTTPYQQDLS